MVHISGNVYFRVVDSSKATFNVNQPIYALVQHAQAVMRRSIGDMELDETFRSREEINAMVRSSLAESCDRWGLEVMRYEVTAIEPDANVSRSMDAQVIAERSRREEVLGAEAAKKSVELSSEGMKSKLENEANGNAFRVQKEAEANFFQAAKVADASAYAQRAAADAMAYEVEKAAQAEATATVVQAEAAAKSVELASKAEAGALQAVGTSLGQNNGEQAAQIELAKKYADTLAALGGESTTMFIPENLGDLPKLMGVGMSLLPGKLGGNKA